MKISSYVLAACLALLGLSCSDGYNHADRAKTSSADSNRTSTAWDKIDNKKQDDSELLRRLESVTWDSVKHQLTWDVSKGDKNGSAYQPKSKDRYEINMDNATMTVNGESRRFSADEAANVRTLMDFVSKYALESTVWWENGEGDPVDEKGTPTQPERRLPHVPNKDSVDTKAIQITAANSEVL